MLADAGDSQHDHFARGYTGCCGLCGSRWGPLINSLVQHARTPRINARACSTIRRSLPWQPTRARRVPEGSQSKESGEPSKWQAHGTRLGHINMRGASARVGRAGGEAHHFALSMRRTCGPGSLPSQADGCGYVGDVNDRWFLDGIAPGKLSEALGHLHCKRTRPRQRKPRPRGT